MTDIAPMDLSVADHGTRTLLLFGHLTHEVVETAQMRRLLPRVSSFADIGANAGWYTGLALAANPGIRLLTGEPNPDVLPLLRRNCAAWGAPSPIEAAFGDEVGETTFYCNTVSSLASAVHGSGPSVTVRTVTLDQAWPDDAVLDLVKCDVEGAEVGVLRGARGLRERDEPIWMLEAEDWHLDQVEIELSSSSLLRFRSDFERGWVEISDLRDAAGIQRPGINYFLVPSSKRHLFCAGATS